MKKSSEKKGTLRLKVGDKVMYIGKFSPRLYIKSGIVYTVESYYIKDYSITLEEVERTHCYDVAEFTLATPLMQTLC